MEFILIVIMHVWQGDTISMQEYGNERSCKAAMVHIQKELIRVDPYQNLRSISCIPKN